jgi:hypothetical protein
MLDLFPELGFRDNLKPSQVTHKVRSELIEVEQRARNRMLFVPFVIAGVADLFLYATVSGKGLATLPGAQILLWELLGVAAAVAAIFWFYRGRIEFLHNALVTPAAVMEIDRTSVWLFGRRSQSPRLAARKVGEASRKGDLGQYEYVPHIVRTRLRFIPGIPGDSLDWEELGDEVPHYDVTKWMSGGGWGTFAGELKQGSLLALLYSPQNPRQCQIVKGFSSHRNRPDT